MSEKEFADKIIDMVVKLEKIAIDFHSKKIPEKQFIESFQDVLLELIVILINFHIMRKNRGEIAGSDN